MSDARRFRPPWTVEEQSSVGQLIPTPRSKRCDRPGRREVAVGIRFVSSGYSKVGEAIRSAAWHYGRASILSLYGRGLPTSRTFCGAVSRGDEQPGMWTVVDC